MITKIKIPVIDTESGKYEYKGRLSREEYEAMVMDNYRKTDRQISAYMNDLLNRDTTFTLLERTDNVVDGEPEILYNLLEAEAYVSDSKKNEVDVDFFNKHIEKGDMFILRINVNPNSMDYDTESELRFWLGDSKNIHSDKTLDNKTKLHSLPSRTICIDLGDGNWKRLINCKILQDFSDEKFKYNFAVITEKII